VEKPAGAGPFPAIVMMHDCSGLGPRSSGAPGRWAKELVAAGYVVIMPDSFSTRGFPGGVCTNADAGRVDVSPRNRANDAHRALAFAQALPYVEKGRIGIMGGSHGGSTTLVAMTRPGFAAGIALYPRCVDRGVYQPAAPVLILIGDRDDWTPAGPCQRLAERARAAGRPVSIKVYPGAHHSFDSSAPERYVAARINPATPGGRGATTGGNAQAWADSKLEVGRFFAQHLK
jgi:dienelactone hydrolase